jgi:tRNA pseudouridine55 synthase
VLAKPAGPTSHDMVALVRRLSGTKRVGHGGTLDPFATGVLPIFLGKATRVVEYHLGATKRYRATVCFGASSTTDDLEGELTPVDGAAAMPTRAAVEAALSAFRGEISQRPPAYSALKVGGRRAYAMARAGETPQLMPRAVRIFELILTGWDDTDPSRPIAMLDVTCSAGTYIRAIARDLGEAIGNAAYLGALTRTASGTFTLADAIEVDRLRAAAAADVAEVRALLRPLDEGLDAMPEVRLNGAERDAVVQGQFVRPSAGLPSGVDQETLVRLLDGDGRLVALGHVRGARVVPEKVLVDIATQPRAHPEPGVSPDPRPSSPSSSPSSLAVAEHAAGAPPAMRVVRGFDALTAADGPLFAVVGVFDGLHRGHRYLLDALSAEAGRRGAQPGVITFDAHPDEILTGAAPPILVDPDERFARLAAAGVAVTVVLHFDRALRMTPYREFIELITARTRLAGLLMTPDAAFGHDRQGTPETLAALGTVQGWDVVVVPPFQIAGRDIRSTDIRSLIAMGDLQGAAALLGRPYAVVGDVGRAGEDPAGVTFRLPVALPHPGRYPVRVEAPAATQNLADPDASIPAASLDAVVDISESAVRLHEPGGRRGRMRIVFRT